MEKGLISREKLIGMQVIDSEGTILGNVKDVSVDLEAKKIGIVVAARTGAEISIPVDDVSQVGDVVILSKKVELPKPPTETPKIKAPPPPPSPPKAPPAAGNICAKCGHVNAPSAKFCIKCGTKIG